MFGELVRAVTKDKLKLQGLLVSPKKPASRVVLYIHGLEGNFYENEFIGDLAEAINEAGFAFCAVNTRGAGVLTDFVSDKTGTITYSSVGAAKELVDDVLTDIQAWIDFLTKRGFKEFVLCGHSLGTIKVIHYQGTKQNPKVKGIILLEPVDYTSFAEQTAGKNFEKYLEKAKKLIDEGKGKELLPDNWHFLVKCSAQTYWDWFRKDSPARIFEFSKKDFNYSQIASLKIPVLAIAGDKDQYIKDTKHTLDLICLHTKDCTPVLIKGGDHWYNGVTSQLQRGVRSWLRLI